MSAKEQIIDFLNLGFLVVLVVFCILYFIVGDRFAAFTEIMRALVPVSIFGIFYLISLKFNRLEGRKRRDEGNPELTLYLGFGDKLISDFVVFFTPIFLTGAFYLAKGTVSSLEIIIAFLVFLILFFWQKYLFSKSR